VSTLRDGDARSLRGKPFPEVAAAFFSVIVVAPIAFWAFVGPRPFNVGFLRSFADLRNAELSKRPNDWWKLAPDLVLKGVTGARLAGSDLRFAQAEGAFLAKADLSDANMEGANLLRTSLQGANLEGANLMNSSVTEMELESACGNEKTLLPEGLKIEFCSDRDLSKKSE
jgi:uncharacterized protein YjbI with pentapeptide repeats